MHLRQNFVERVLSLIVVLFDSESRLIDVHVVFGYQMVQNPNKKKDKNKYIDVTSVIAISISITSLFVREKLKELQAITKLRKHHDACIN